MRKALRWLGLLVMGLAMLAIALFGVTRLRGPSEGQKAALAILEAPSPTPGRNAYALVWLLPYEVPESDRDRVLADDARRFANTPVTPGQDSVAEFTSIAAKSYSPLPELDRRRYCRWREPGCLAKVRAEPDIYADLIKADAALLARAGTIGDYGHFRSPFPPRVDMPFPPLNYLAYPMTRHAHAFVSGDIEAGLDGTCRGISGARMLIHDGDNVLSAMVGVAMLQGNVELLADMLAKLPVKQPLPASCTIALAPPVQDEFSLCSAVRGEARYVFGTMRLLDESNRLTDNPWLDRLRPVLYDYDKSAARMAPHFAWYCGTQARAAVDADLPTKAPQVRPTLTSFECLDNFLGCGLADVSSLSLEDYQHRLQDASIRLKAMTTLLWLRNHPDSLPLPERLAQRPASLRSRSRELQPGKDGTSLSVELFDRRQGARLTLPLPASQLPTRR